MSFSKKLIGFDIRSFEKDFLKSRWTKESRDIWLLRPEIETPLSVDTSTWPSSFTGPFPESESTWYFNIFDVWSNYAEMMSRYESRADRKDFGIAIAVVCESADEEMKILEHAIEIESPQIDPKWKSLGYDIADDWKLSGLMNCGFTKDEVSPLRSEWVQHLNEHGLFVDPKQALLFRELTNTRVSEHAPFYVYEIFLIWGELD